MTESRAKYGDIDWNAVWRARQIRHERSERSEDPTHNWDKVENAKRYNEGTCGGFDTRVKMTLAGLDISRQSRILDIGAGPGTLALPLAPLVKEVTAVEPGKGMIQLLFEKMAERGIGNITIVKKLWEDVRIYSDLFPPYDIVISSLSLTMADLRDALAKMDAVSSRYVCIFWFADPPFWERMYIDLWPDLHGRKYYPGPKADCVFNVLNQMGIYANVEMLPLGKEYRFASREDMTAFFRRRFGIQTARQGRVLETYLGSRMRDDGSDVVISGDSVLAKIWWKKAG
ncbi:MAG TPA: class I SAM-dependent methyltransferase [Methanoregulaceae archaeon]|nr:class I SAM-dependent methyltransferase [Methanoregulaceae archaeon]